MRVKSHTKNKQRFLTLVPTTFSLVAYFFAANALAQEKTTTDENDDLEGMVEEVIVTGIRANLQNAQEIKRDADTFVDAISAKDIGALPDRSVLEAIQRIPGVAVERFAGPQDPDHFSVEGSGAIIRGMTQTRSEFNGRDSFTANSGRGLSFQDVPPELMGKVEVFKNQTADMIEGGIGGTVSLHTRKPFDSEGRQLAATFDYSYGDIAKEGSPTFSALYSDRWDTGAGEFGFLINIADSTLYGESHGIQSDAYTQYWARNIAGAERFVDTDGSGTIWIPNASNALKKTDDRERKGLATSFQWSSPDGNITTTLEYIRSEAKLTWFEQSLKYQGGYSSIDNPKTEPLDTGNAAEDVFVIDDQGLFQAGTLAWGWGQWRASGVNMDHFSQPWGYNSRPQFGHKMQAESRLQDNENIIDDVSFKIDWQITDRLNLEADIQHIDAETNIDDLSISIGLMAFQAYDTRGNTPKVTFIEPWNGYRDTNPEQFQSTDPNNSAIPDYYPGFTNDPQGDSNYFQDPNSYFWRSGMDKYERSEGDSNAISLKTTYDFEDSFFTAIKTGVRYAKRNQILRDTGYNWDSIAPEWSSSRAGWLMDDAYAAQMEDWEYVDWSDFHGGGIVNIPGNTTIHAKEDFVRAVMAPNNSRSIITSGGGSWENYSSNNVYDLFLNGDIAETTETNKAIYVRLDFAGEGEVNFSGNIGLRYVNLKRETTGFVNYPDLIPEMAPPTELGSNITREEVLNYFGNPTGEEMKQYLLDPVNAWALEEVNYLSENELNFGSNASETQTTVTDFDMYLPSFNIKLELSDELIARFAIAKAVALPDIGDVKNRIDLGSQSLETTRDLPVDQDNPTAEEQLISSAYVSSWNASGGNPYLKPMTSVQYDFALEWYFSRSNHISGTLFHKNLNNYFIKGGNFREMTNPDTGVTQLVDVYTDVNGDAAKMDGFEISYQQFFDGWFDGFGIQASYTYIDASGVPNNEESYDEASWVDQDGQDTYVRVDLDSVPLQGQSKDTVNLIGMYEKGSWSARLAYNWRSKYLLTTRDVISKAPLFYDDHGQLDGSVFYKINGNFEVGIQGTNITNSQSETIMLLNNQGLKTGRSWFVADRRVALILKARL